MRSRFALALLTAGALAGPASADPILVVVAGTFESGAFTGEPYAIALTYDDQNIRPASFPAGTATAYLPGAPNIDGVTGFGDLTGLSVLIPALGGPVTAFDADQTYVQYTNGSLSHIEVAAPSGGVNGPRSLFVTLEFNPDGPLSSASIQAGRSDTEDEGFATNPGVVVVPLNSAPVPEPATLAVFAGLAGVGGLVGRRRKPAA